MRQKTKEYILKVFDGRVKDAEAAISERQRWLEYHKKDVDFFNRNHDQTFDEYEAWATGIIERKKTYIAELKEMVKEIEEE